MNPIYIALGCFFVVGLLLLMSYFDKNDEENTL